MDLEHLRAFLAVAGHGGFTRAARALGRSQPTVSRQVKQLETALGVPLFERLGKAVHLTEAGRLLADDGARLLGDVTRTEEALRALGGLRGGSLRIGAGTTPGLYVVPGIIARLLQRMPALDIHYTVTNSAEVGKALSSNAIDVGFVGRRLEHGSLDHRPLLQDDVTCVAGPQHPLAGLTVTVAELDAHLQVQREPGSATRAHVEAALGPRPGRPVRRIQLTGPEAVKALVRAGVGWAWLSSLAVAREIERGELAPVRVSGVRPRRSIHVVLHPDKRLTPALRELLAEAGALAP